MPAGSRRSVCGLAGKHTEDCRLSAGTLFNARLQALAAAHDILTQDNWRDANIADVVSTAIRAYRVEGGGRFDIEGAPLRVPPQLALTLAMVLHELVTNAAKYGALSAPGGAVRVSWRTEQHEGNDMLRLRWQERGGPRVRKPKTTGFGTRLIERSFANFAGGEVELRYEPASLVCTISVPVGN